MIAFISFSFVWSRLIGLWHNSNGDCPFADTIHLNCLISSKYSCCFIFLFVSIFGQYFFWNLFVGPLNKGGNKLRLLWFLSSFALLYPTFSANLYLSSSPVICLKFFLMSLIFRPCRGKYNDCSGFRYVILGLWRLKSFVFFAFTCKLNLLPILFRLCITFCNSVGSAAIIARSSA